MTIHCSCKVWLMVFALSWATGCSTNGSSTTDNPNLFACGNARCDRTKEYCYSNSTNGTTYMCTPFRAQCDAGAGSCACTTECSGGNGGHGCCSATSNG